MFAERLHILLTANDISPRPKTFNELATAVHLQVEDVRWALMEWRLNSSAREALFRQFENDLEGDGYQGLRERLSKRPKADSAGRADDILSFLWRRGNDGGPTSFAQWPVDESDFGKVLIGLPLSPSMANLLLRTTGVRSRETPIAGTQPLQRTFKGLEVHLQDLDRHAEELLKSAAGFHHNAGLAAESLRVLDMLCFLIDALLAYPHRHSTVSATRRDRMQDLRTSLDSLCEAAERTMVLEPPLPELMAEFEENSERLLAAVQDSDFVERVRYLQHFRDLVPQRLYEQTLDTIRKCYAGLLQSPASETVLEDFQAMLDSMSAPDEARLRLVAREARSSSQRDEPSGVSTTTGKDNVLTVMASIGSLTEEVIGPEGLVVELLEIAAPMLWLHVAENPEKSSAFARSLATALIRISRMEEDQARELLAQLAEGKVDLLTELREGDFSRISRGPHARGLFVLVNLICFAATVNKSEEITLENWKKIALDLAKSGGDLANSLFPFFDDASILIKSGKRVTKSIKVFGAFAAVLEGAKEFGRGADEGCAYGMMSGVMVGGTGLIKLGGHLCKAGFMVARFPGLQKYGAWLAALGTALTVIDLSIDLVKTWAKRSKIVFDAYFGYFLEDQAPRATHYHNRYLFHKELMIRQGKPQDARLALHYEKAEEAARAFEFALANVKTAAEAVGHRRVGPGFWRTELLDTLCGLCIAGFTDIDIACIVGGESRPQQIGVGREICNRRQGELRDHVLRR